MIESWAGALKEETGDIVYSEFDLEVEEFMLLNCSVEEDS